MKPTLAQLRGPGFTRVRSVQSSPNPRVARTIEVFQGGGTYWWANYDTEEKVIGVEEVEPVVHNGETLYHQKGGG